MKRWCVYLVVLAACGSSTPVKPSERASIVVTAGDSWAVVSTCRADWTHEEKQQRVGAFTIDQDAVSCDEWNACVAAGKCKSRKLETCDGQTMLVRRQGAATFCGWHGARLPTLAEWSRAARGETKLLRRDETQPCVEVPLNKERLSRCAYTGPTGMRFSLTTDFESEWTSEDDCIEANDGGGFEVAVGLGSNALSRVKATVAAFRCVKDSR